MCQLTIINALCAIDFYKRFFMSTVIHDTAAARTPTLTPYTRYKVYTQRQMEQIEALQRLTPEQRFEMEVVAQILPFRVNEYVINELIDWDNIPADPIFQLTFPQRSEEHTSELQSRGHLVCRLLLEKKNLLKQSQH